MRGEVVSGGGRVFERDVKNVAKLTLERFLSRRQVTS